MKARLDRTTLLLGTLAAGALVALAAVVAPPSGTAGVPRPDTVRREVVPPAPTAVGIVSALDFLPPRHATDGSVDYTRQLQSALDRAAGGTLLLPPFPVLVSARPGQRWCLRVGAPTEIVGTAGSLLRERAGAVQVLRAENVSGLTLRGFAVQGLDAEGTGLAHGLVQVTGGRDVRVEGVTVRDSDADGIAIANVQGVVVHGCTVQNASKSGIYLSRCSDASVVQNAVSGCGGQLTAAHDVVGAGIQLSSSSGVVCASNTVRGGVGVGILCNALAGGERPLACVLADNVVSDVHNPANPNVSSGIRCTNGSADKTTLTLVSGNIVRRCGAHGIYLENHGGSQVLGNTIVESDWSGLAVATVDDVVVADNAILSSGTAPVAAYGLLLLNDARRVTARDNLVRDLPGLELGSTLAATHDLSRGGGHSLEPRVVWDQAPPVSGRWQQGDRVLDPTPESGLPSGWVCVASGTPGTWAPFARVE